jgi:hypothetical protein
MKPKFNPAAIATIVHESPPISAPVAVEHSEILRTDLKNKISTLRVQENQRTPMETSMKKMNATRSENQREEALDGRYGKIGISAVAAAVRYQSDAKNPAYAPTAMQDDDRFVEARAA